MNQPQRTKLYLEGRYRKLSRDLPQTVFYCPDCKGHPRRRKGCERCEGFGKLTRDSVQELVAWVVGKAYGTRKNKFHGAGREDLDVRMLGDGRPFVLELQNPKVFDVDLAELEAELNRRNEGRLEVVNLHHAEKARIVELKEGKHAKEYAALVEVDGEVDPERLAGALGQRVVVAQETPQRVAHRRADLVRERWIELVAAEPVEPATDERSATWRFTLRTEHGTYVKEALSGEDGRTKPSVGELLGVACRCVELDVLAILTEGGSQEDEQPVFLPPFGHGV